jgi:hypothetical protein
MEEVKKAGEENEELLGEAAADIEEEDGSDPLAPIFLLLFNKLPELSAGLLERGLARFGKPEQALELIDLVSDGETPHVTVQFDGHYLLLIAYDEPGADENTTNAINCSNWTKEDKKPLRNHQAHMLCIYMAGSDDATEKIIACMRLAGAFLDAGLLGYVDPAAWNCMPAPRLREALSAKARKQFRQAVPLGVFTGFVKIFTSETEIWFCTKGYFRWGISDLAFYGTLAQAQEVFTMFEALFFYSLSSEKQIIAGNTAELGGDVLLSFEELYEYEEVLQAPLGTLVIKKINRDQLH